MSCYFRHLNDILNEAGIEITPRNRKEIDRIIHAIVGVNYKDCSTTWGRIKREILNDKKKRYDFVEKLKCQSRL
jgi:hypothetical protein